MINTFNILFLQKPVVKKKKKLKSKSTWYEMFKTTSFNFIFLPVFSVEHSDVWLLSAGQTLQWRFHFCLIYPMSYSQILQGLHCKHINNRFTYKYILMNSCSFHSMENKVRETLIYQDMFELFLYILLLIQFVYKKVCLYFIICSLLLNMLLKSSIFLLLFTIGHFIPYFVHSVCLLAVSSFAVQFVDYFIILFVLFLVNSFTLFF